MVGFYKGLIILLLIIFALALFPTVHLGVGNVDMTGFLPILAMITTAFPYILLGIVAYVILKIK